MLFIHSPQPNTELPDSPNYFLKVPLFVISGPTLLFHKLLFHKITCNISTTTVPKLLRTNKLRTTKLGSLITTHKPRSNISGESSTKVPRSIKGKLVERRIWLRN